MPLNRIVIKSLKKGKDRIVSYNDESGYLEYCRLNFVQPFSDYNRFFIYRLYKKNGLSLYHPASNKYSVTHAFRHLFAQMSSSSNVDKSLMSEFLGHKSKKSIDSYLS